jgi:hypothetical protein
MIDRDIPGTFAQQMACGEIVRMKTFDMNDVLEQDRFQRAVEEHMDDCPKCKEARM